MKISSRPQDKEYRDDFADYLPYVDDSPQLLAFFADEEAGVCKVYMTLPDGRIAATGTGKPKTKVLRGKVRIVRLSS